MSARRALARWGVPALFAIAAASTAGHAAHDLARAVDAPGVRPWLLVAYDLLRTAVALAFAVFTIGRAAPHRPARSPLAFLACAGAMIAVVAFAPPSPSTPVALLLTGDLITVAFGAWLLVSVLTLGRCFGVLPEARGLVCSGPYRIVRHPVYLGEIGACTGLLIAAPSLRNASLMAALLLAQSVRMRLEELALGRAFPRYVEYAARTPRLLPRISLGLAAPSRSERPLGGRARLGEASLASAVESRLES